MFILVLRICCMESKHNERPMKITFLRYIPLYGDRFTFDRVSKRNVVSSLLQEIKFNFSGFASHSVQNDGGKRDVCLGLGN